MFARGSRVGSYQVEKKIGEGGMGEVYLVREVGTDRYFALKVALTDAPPIVHQRFRQEVKVTERFHDPHLIAARETGIHESGSARIPYLVMEYLKGETLADTIERKSAANQVMTVHEIVDVSRQIAVGLAGAHAKAIVHRDLKPSNVFVCRTGATDLVKLIDFGLALIQRETIVDPGTPMLSPPYAAPELWARWSSVTEAVDVYAFGCTLFEMATGQPPFGMGGPLQQAHSAHDVPDLDARRRGHKGAKLPRPFVAMVKRMLAKDPAKRPNVGEVKAILDTIADGDPDRKDGPRTVGWLLVLTGAVGLAGIAAILGGRSCTPGVTHADAGYLAPTQRPIPNPLDEQASIDGSPHRPTATAPLIDASSIGSTAGPFPSDASSHGHTATPVIVDASGNALDTRPSSAVPTIVPPTMLEASRIAGAKNIDPDETTKTEIRRSGKEQTIGSLKVCLDKSGDVTSVSLLKSTGFPNYDDRLRTTILSTWKYKPWLIDGRPAPVCTAVTFIYKPACNEVDCVLDNYQPACCAPFKRGGGSVAHSGSGTGSPELDRAMISAGVFSVKPLVEACADHTSAKGTVKVHVKIAPEGSVTSVSIETTPDAALGACVADAMKKATFPATVAGGSFAYPFVF